MSKPRILFIPAFLGTPSHFIPLAKLYQRLDPARYDAAFLLPKVSPEWLRRSAMERYLPRAEYYYCGDFYSHFDIPVLPVRRTYSVAAELQAYSVFDPDVIIDDCNLTTALTSQVIRKPRVTLLRAGTFPTDAAHDSGLRNTLNDMIDTVRIPPDGRLTKPDSVAGFFVADAYIVPGIDAIEPGHPASADRARTFFSGPLILDEQEECIFQSEALDTFFADNRELHSAYVSFGVDPSRGFDSRLIECFRCLLEAGFAVLTNVPLLKVGGDDLLAAAGKRLLVESTVPLHRVTASADLVIHVAGSAMYHYPLLHLTPAITVGTRALDRETIARKLESFGLSLHLPAPSETEGFVELFKNAIERFVQGQYPFDTGLPARLRAHQQNILRATSEFELSQVIETALAFHGDPVNRTAQSHAHQC
jgi:hypothetical protein